MDGLDGPPQAGGAGVFVRRMIRAGVAGLFAAVLMACSSGDDPPAQVVEASATIDAAGGTVTGPDGVVVKIPAGALTEPTVIRIARTAAGSPSAPPDGYTVGDKVYEITPHDLVFLYPVTIEMPWSAGTGDQSPFKASPSDVWLPVGATIDGGTASWLTNSFSWFMMGECAQRTDDELSCVTPSVQPSVVSSVADAITPRHGGPESIAWTVTKATTLDITLNYSAAADCGDAKLTVTRRANGGRLAAKLVDTAVSLGTDPENAKRRRGSHLWQLPMSEADNGLGAYDVRFSCQRPGSKNRASAGGTLMFYGSNIAPQPAEAPAFVSDPQDVTVTVGSTATFSVTASGVPTPALQWQLSTDAGANWTNISGATNASYTTPTTIAGDSGKLFRVVATNASGSVNSNAAMLTVTQSATTTWSALSTVSDGWYDAFAIGIGSDQSANALAVWVSLEPGSVGVITRQKVYSSFRVKGGTWSAPSIVYADPLLSSEESRLAVGANGSAVAIWRKPDNGSNQQWLLASRYDNGTRTWGQAETVALVGGGAPIGGHGVAIDGMGRAAATWWQTWSYSIRLSVDTGSGWSSAPVELATSGSNPTPVVAIDAQGRGFVAWKHSGGLAVQPIDLGAANPVTGVPVQFPAASLPSKPGLAMSSDGHALLTWLEDAETTLRAARFVPATTAGAGGWVGPETVATGVRVQLSPSIAIDGDGNGFIAWLDNVNDPPILASARYDVANGWSGLAQLSHPNSQVRWLDLAMNSAGRAAVIWGELSASPTFQNEVWTRIYEGGNWGTPTRVQQPANQRDMENAGAISVAENATSDIAAAWIASTGNGWGVFAVTSP